MTEYRRMPIALVATCLLWLVLTATVVEAGVESQLQQIIRSSNIGQTQVSIYAVDLTERQILVDIDADQPMIPASNMKLLTTAAALDVLGMDFVFETSLHLLPAADGESLPSLLVRGDGDPALGDPVIMRMSQPPLQPDMLIDAWVQTIKNQNITRFERLLIDDRVFDQQFVHPDWPEDQLDRHYCAQVAGINFYLNTIDISVTPSRHQGQAPLVTLYPRADFLPTTNRATTANVDSFWASRPATSNNLTFHGRIRNRTTVPYRLTIHDPSMFFGELLAERLREEGIEVGSVARPAAHEQLPDIPPIHIIRTPMMEVIARTNQDSVNLFAEALLKRMGRQVTGTPGSWNNGAAAMRQVLRQRLQARGSTVVIADGSGMSRNNRVTARLLVDLLQSMHEDETLAGIYRQSLAEGGRSGTLRHRFNQINGEVFAKTGYIREVSTLSGYLVIPNQDDAENEPRVIAFSILCNGFQRPLSNADMRQLHDRLLQAIERNLTAQVQLGG